MGQLVILVGEAGVGKSAIRDRLADRLGYVGLGPDDFPHRWWDIYWRLDAFDSVLECCQIPSAVRRRMTETTTVIELTAPTDVRRMRLRQQGLGPREVEGRLSPRYQGLGYEEEIEPTLTIETTEDPEVLVERIAQVL